MRNTKTLFVILILVIIYINSKRTKITKKKFKQITFDDFELFFDKLIKNKLDASYVGLTSNSIDCLYFHTEKNRINIEYEVTDKAQVNYAKKLVNYAKKKGFDIEVTSYENKTNYNDKTAPVYQIICNLDLLNAVIISKEIFIKIFKSDSNTNFDLII